MPFSLAQTHDSSRGQAQTVGWIWKKFPPKMLQLLTRSSCRLGSGIVIDENYTMRYHARTPTAFQGSTVITLGNQSISRGPR